MGILSNLFGMKNTAAQDMINRGAVIIDVRTPGEFQGGHVAGSKNIPLNTVANRVDEIKKMNKPVVLCCASGMRSGQATSVLKRAGIECVNGGGWMQVNAMVK